MKVLEINRAMLGTQNQCRLLISLLTEIKGVGFDALYLLPVVKKGKKNSVGSPYCIADFWALDPAFGVEEDWSLLRDECRSLGLEIWIDWVMNHTAWDHPWLSEKPVWYERDENGLVTHPPGTAWTDVAQLDGSESLMNAFAEIAVKWVQQRGISGFRCDAAYRISSEAWRVFFAKCNPMDKGIRWIADKAFDGMDQLSFSGFTSTSIDLIQVSRNWVKLYDHDRAAFGPLWNASDQALWEVFRRDQNSEIHWIIGMGIMYRSMACSFFQNQIFDPEKWEKMIVDLSQ